MKLNLPTTTLTRIVYLGLFLGVLVALFILLRTKPVEVESTAIQRGKFEERFNIDGKIRSKNKTTVVAFASGDIDEITLKAGDAVRKGEDITLLRWDYSKKVRSPMDGVIVKVYRQSAGPVTRGEPLLDIVDPNEVEIVAEPLTSDAMRVLKGAPVEVTGFGGNEQFQAKVVNISRAGYEKTSALGVEEERTEVRMEFVAAPKELLQRVGDNFHVEVSILLSVSEDVLKVPLGALFKADGQWAVYKIVNNRARLQRLEISGKNEREAAIVRGLEEGERVILFPSDMISENTVVK